MISSSLCRMVPQLILLVDADQSSSIRAKEKALAAALRAKDITVLSTLTDQKLRVSWTEGSAIRNVSTDEGKDEWMEHISHLEAQSYQAVISTIHVAHGSQATVELQEYWVICSDRGTPIARHFHTTDFWFKWRGSWTLTGRVCYSLHLNSVK